MSAKLLVQRRPDAAGGVDDEAAAIAIVDDDASVRCALLRLIRCEGYSAAAFPSATALLSSLSLQTPRCVVLDLHLRDMTGMELLRRFAKLADAPPVVVITGNDDRRLRDQCMALGTRRYLSKPIDCDALLGAIGEILCEAPRGSQ